MRVNKIKEFIENLKDIFKEINELIFIIASVIGALKYLIYVLFN